MGLALETIVGYVASLTGSTTYDALTANANQSFTVRYYVDGSSAWLEDIWTGSTTEDTLLSIKSPRLHDDVLGIQLAGNPEAAGSGSADFNPQTLLPGYLQQKLYSSDVLSVTANGTASDVFVGVFNVREVRRHVEGVDEQMEHAADFLRCGSHGSSSIVGTLDAMRWWAIRMANLSQLFLRRVVIRRRPRWRRAS